MPVPVQKPGRSEQTFVTPHAFIAATKRLLQIDAFAFDFAASCCNTQASQYFDDATDAMVFSGKGWAERVVGGWGWLNPPYTDIEPWVERCKDAKRAGAHIALLVPASVGADWFRDHVDGHAQVKFLNGRLGFLPDQPKALYPKDCILCLYGARPGYAVWSWRTQP